MNRGTAGIVLIMLAILGMYLYIRSDFIKKLLGGSIPGVQTGAGGGGSSGAMALTTGGSLNAEAGQDLSGGTVQPGTAGIAFSGSANVGETGTAYGLGFPSPTNYADYTSYPDPQRDYGDENLTNPIKWQKFGSLNFGSNFAA